MPDGSPITLEEVRAAIRSILVGGQRVRLRDGAEYTRAGLDQLRAMEQELAASSALTDLGVDAGGGYLPVGFGELH
jgi:hypothetical protein